MSVVGTAKWVHYTETTLVRENKFCLHEANLSTLNHGYVMIVVVFVV